MGVEIERTDFLQFLCWEVVVVLKELIFNSSMLGVGVVVLKELIFYIYIIDLMV